MRIAALITCHNRRDLTVRCLYSLFAQTLPPDTSLAVYVVDDGSTDGTSAEIMARFKSVNLIAGSGDLYWAGGMSLAWKVAAAANPDAFLWLNDDVELVADALTTLRQLASREKATVLVGSCQDLSEHKRTYGGLLRDGLHPGKTKPVTPGTHAVPCDTFEGNIVWVPREVYRIVGSLGPYRHAMADIDYGYRVAAAGLGQMVAPGFLGVCAANSEEGTWKDASISRRLRFHKLLQIKGLPFRDWWRFCSSHGSFLAPLYFISPFVRVLLGRGKSHAR